MNSVSCRVEVCGVIDESSASPTATSAVPMIGKIL